jgi:hypothetical protein
MLSHAESCWVMLSHAESCWVMLSHAESCWVMLSHAKPYWVMLSDTTSIAESCWTMLSCAESCFILLFCSKKKIFGHCGHVYKATKMGKTNAMVLFFLYVTLGFPKEEKRSIWPWKKRQFPWRTIKTLFLPHHNQNSNFTKGLFKWNWPQPHHFFESTANFLLLQPYDACFVGPVKGFSTIWAPPSDVALRHTLPF